MMLSDDQATRLICGVLSALNATKMGGPLMATQERVAEAIKNLPSTQAGTVIRELTETKIPEIVRPHG